MINKKMWLLVLLSLNINLAFAIEETKPWGPICKQVNNQSLPKADQPDEADKTELADCDSEALYYGIGAPVDYIKARKCAYIEMSLGDKGPFSGASILMMIYANGFGVHRNLDLATKIACDSTDLFMVEGETEGQINELQQLKIKPETKPYDICNHMDTSNELAMCAARDARIAKAKRDVEMKKIISAWTSEQQKAFEQLQQVANVYFKLRQENEVDLTGTIRGVNYVAAGEAFDTDFDNAIKDFEKGKLPNYSAEDFKLTDEQLNKEYTKIMHMNEEEWQSTGMGTVTKEGIKKTQRAWIHYRDAWVKFGAIRYPNVSADSWKTWLTKQRTEEGFSWSIA